MANAIHELDYPRANDERETISMREARIAADRSTRRAARSTPIRRWIEFALSVSPFVVVALIASPLILILVGLIWFCRYKGKKV